MLPFPTRPAPVPDPKVVLDQLNQRADQLKRMTAIMGDRGKKGTHAGGIKHHSTTSFSRLKRIEYRSMKLRKQQIGRYIIIRVVSRVVKNVGLSFLG